MTMHGSVVEISPIKYLARILSSGAANWLAKKNSKLKYPRLCCFPDDYIGRSIVAHGAYEELFLIGVLDNLLKHRAGEFRGATAVDVGANIGNHSLWFSRRFRRVVSFEPNPVCAHMLRASVAVNGVKNITVHEIGLGDFPGKASFAIGYDGNLGGSHIVTGPASLSPGLIEIAIESGDSILDSNDNADERIALIKIDVEGHERAVLRGLENTLRRHSPVVLFESMGSAQDGPDGVFNFLRSLGYKRFRSLEPRIRSRWRVLRAIDRLVFGYRLMAVEVGGLEDRFYPLIVAEVD